MCKLIVSITILLTVFSCLAQESDLTFEQKIKLSERMVQFQVPGVSIAVINNYKVEWAKEYGVVKVGSDTPVTPETYFEAASTTKLLGSIIVLRLVEQGHLNLDVDVNKYLKSWKIPESEFTQEEKVTLRRLLTHQSGLNRPDGGFSRAEGNFPSLLQVLKGEAPAENPAAVVEYVPGSKHQYSNMGYLVIQLLLEDTLDKLYPQIVQEIIFEPIGMKNSTLVHPLKPEIQKNLALPHDREGKAHDRPQSPTALAQGGLVTTPADLSLLAIELMRAYQGHSNRILSQNTVQQMFTVEKGDLDPAQFGGFSQGLGVFLMGEGQNLFFAYAGHNFPGTTSMLFASPATGKGAVIMANGVAGIQLSMEIFPDIEKEYSWPKMQ